MSSEYKYYQIDGKDIEYHAFRRTGHDRDESLSIYNELRRCDVIAFALDDDEIVAYKYMNQDVRAQDSADMKELMSDKEVCSHYALSLFGGDELYDMIADDIAELMTKYNVSKNQVIAALEEKFGISFDGEISVAWTADECSILYAYAVAFMKDYTNKNQNGDNNGS